MCLPDQDTGQYKCNHFSKMNLTASTQHLSLSGDYQYAMVYLLGAILVKFEQKNPVTDKNTALT